jgi:RND family efflux transporter MFP subunit
MTDEEPIMTQESALAPRPTGARKALVALGVVMLGFAVFVGARVSGALGTRASARQEQAAASVEVKAAAARPPEVDVVRGRSMSWQAAVPFEGSLSAHKDADLGFKTPGRLAQIKVKVGDRVAVGRVLATLETGEAEAQLAAAEAQLAAAQAQSALANDGARRTALMVKSGAQSEAVGVQAEKQRQLAEAQMNAVRAQGDLARTALTNHTLQAPFAGTITRAPTAPGAVVAPGAPLFHLADLGTLKLVGTVSPDDARLVKVGTAVEVLSDDGRSVVASGKVSAIIPALDAATKRLPVEATINNDRNPEGREPLLAGAVVRATLKGAVPITVLAFPHTVLRPGTQNEVLVVRDGKLAVRQIEHVIAADGDLLVRRGLDAKDDVVLLPWPEAHEGQVVTLAMADQSAQAEKSAKPAAKAVP